MKQSYHQHATDLVLELGSSSQCDRLAAGLTLPENELNGFVRNYLMAPIAEQPRWKRIGIKQMRQLAVMRGTVGPGEHAYIEFEVVPSTELTGEGFERYQAVRKAMPHAELKLFYVLATCNDELIQRIPKVRVIVNWHGRDFLTEIYLGTGEQWAPSANDETVAV